MGKGGKGTEKGTGRGRNKIIVFCRGYLFCAHFWCLGFTIGLVLLRSIRRASMYSYHAVTEGIFGVLYVHSVFGHWRSRSFLIVRTRCFRRNFSEKNRSFPYRYPMALLVTSPDVCCFGSVCHPTQVHGRQYQHEGLMARTNQHVDIFSPRKWHGRYRWRAKSTRDHIFSPKPTRRYIIPPKPTRYNTYVLFISILPENSHFFISRPPWRRPTRRDVHVVLNVYALPNRVHRPL